jgi:hypothetical protein
MSFESIRKNIQSYFLANFTGVSADKIAWDNVDFEIPENTSWIRFSVQTLIADFVSVGGANVKVRSRGIVFVQVFVPRATSTLNIDVISDQISSVLEAVQLSTGETFSAVTKNDIGQSEGWYQVNLSIPFYYDYHRGLS